MHLKIRKIETTDLHHIVWLLHEFAEHEQLADYCEVDEPRLFDAMFGEAAIVEGLIALDSGSPVGLVLYYPNFSSFRGEMGIHIEDLYVREEYRGKGLGSALLREMANIARERGLVRLDFMVQVNNLKAITFYEKLGAISNPDERHFKFSGDALKDLSR